MSGMNGGVIVTPEDLGEVEGKEQWETLGEKLDLEISEAQFKKFYDAETGKYDFKSHLKEAQFQAEQAAKKGGEPKDDDKDEVASPEALEKAVEVVQEAGLDEDKLAQEILETGTLSPETRKVLNDKGIADATIDAHIAGLEALAVVQLAEVMTELGGEEGIAKLKKLVDDAGWSKEKRGEIETALASPAWRDAVAELKALEGRNPAEAPSGDDPEPENDGIEGFATQDDLVAAMQDPRYRAKTVEGNKYRAEVMEKAKRSTYHLDPRAHTAGF